MSQSAARRRQRGVTLLELLIVTALIALMAGITYPSAAAGIESMRMRSMADRISNLLSASIDRAQRRQQVVEVWISPKDNVIIARSPDADFARRMELPPGMRITAVFPSAETDPMDPRRFLMYPGGTVPTIGIELSNAVGSRRIIRVDALSQMPRAMEVRR